MLNKFGRRGQVRGTLRVRAFPRPAALVPPRGFFTRTGKPRGRQRSIELTCGRHGWQHFASSSLCFVRLRILIRDQNLHVATTYVDGSGKVSSQMNLGRHWLVGAQGGSRTANRDMRSAIKERLSPDIPAEELAEMLEQYETEEYTYEYTREDVLVTVLHGLSGADCATNYERDFGSSLSTGL